MELSGQLHALAVLPQEKSLQYPLDRRLGGPQSWSRHGGEEKNSQRLLGPETQSSSLQPSTTLLSYPKHGNATSCSTKNRKPLNYLLASQEGVYCTGEVRSLSAISSGVTWHINREISIYAFTARTSISYTESDA
jgi:hypothetical protein